MDTNRIQFYSPHSPEACVDRLTQTADRFGALGGIWAQLVGKNPVIGQWSESQIQLSRRIRGRNSFQPVLFASLQAKGTGTVIDGRIGLHPLVIIVTTLWFAIVSFLGGRAIWQLLTRMRNGEDVIEALVVAGILFSVIFMGGCFVIWAGRYASRNDSTMLRQFLIKTLDAHDAPELLEKTPSP
jgi:hypothetical protein